MTTMHRPSDSSGARVQKKETWQGIFFLILLIFPFSVHAQNITTVAGCNGCSTLGDGGPATAASIGYTPGIAINSSGDIFIADANHNRIRKVDALTGIITTVAGTGVAGYNGDNIPATTAQLNSPQFVICDQAGNLYVSDPVSKRVRKISTTGIITTFAGNGSIGDTGDNGPATAATLKTPQGLAFDGIGNLYVTDLGSQKIRRIDTFGIIVNIAGNGVAGFSGDGDAATLAELYNPQDVAIDNYGNLLIADHNNNRIRKVDLASGKITTVVGYSPGGYNGDEGPATSAWLAGPWGIATDGYGAFYIADYSNNRIRKVDAGGIIHTVAGNGTPGNSGDNGPATSAEIDRPEGVRTDQCGNVYVADFNNRSIRKITYYPPPCWPADVQNISMETNISIYPNPVDDELHISSGAVSSGSEQRYMLMNIIGMVVMQGGLHEGDNSVPVAALPAGMYMVEVVRQAQGERGVRIVKRIMKL